MTVTHNNTSPSVDKTESAAQEALQKWVELNRSVLDIFLDAYVVVDLSNKVIAFNEAFTDLCGESYRRTLKIGHFCELLKTEPCPEQCPAKQVVTSGRPLRIDELRAATKTQSNLQLILGAVPLTVEGVGVVGSLLTIRNVSAENELQKKYDEKKRDSITDGLTRLFNKVYTESSLNRMIKSSSKENIPVSLLMCDIDHFKKVNDVYGHQAGDHVLSLVAQMLKGETRDNDIAGRFGGEEFMVVLHNANKEGIKAFAERFRKRVETTQFIFEGKTIPVTVSLGSATLLPEANVPGKTDEEKAKDMVHRADTALYLAKANGRNRTCQSEDLPENPEGGRPGK